jgi:hypothetical protein
LEVGVPTNHDVELRGVLSTISARFYAGGWGFGTLQTDDGLVKITGTLEGHVEGTSLVVRGAFKDTAYGRQLDCSSIIVDSVSGNLAVIRAWARRQCPDYIDDIERVCRKAVPRERWAVLSSEIELCKAGLQLAKAAAIAAVAQSYLALIRTKKGLMELGFTDSESEKLCKTYGEQVNRVLSEDPYVVVLGRALSFSRVDAVMAGRTPRNHPRRLHAAQVQALLDGQRYGHTAMVPVAVEQEAADMAGVYREAIATAGVPREIVSYDGWYQLRSVAAHEQSIATWFVEAMKRS